MTTWPVAWAASTAALLIGTKWAGSGDVDPQPAGRPPNIHGLLRFTVGLARSSLLLASDVIAGSELAVHRLRLAATTWPVHR